ncbi:DeoR/GlpR family transcriptional regulator [Zooshikella sp. RANM57]|uniref:DeoR/GlpR family transcriptional regulator n=1 Tax=Zooshikella sp. RANM57 TaxID=3425863 RepID=UPI003D6F4A34
MSQTHRHEQILQLVQQKGFVSIDELVQRFTVTPQTIRRDLNQLAETCQLKRYHGGAGIPTSSITNTAYAQRKIMQLSAKQKIAQRVAKDIPNNSSLFINIGTTTEAIAEALLQHQGLTVITNNLHVASILKNKEDFNILLSGGQVRNRDGGIIGQATVDFISQFTVDYGIIGISGIDQEGQLLDYDYQEVRVAQAIIKHSRQVFLATDVSKFGRNALVKLAQLREIDRLYTNTCPPEQYLVLTEQADTELVIA